MSRSRKYFSVFLVIAFLLVTITQPVMASDNAEEDLNSETATSDEQVSIESEEYDETDLEYESEADSWRYQNGHISSGNEEETFNSRSRAAFVPWSKINGNFVNDRGEAIKGALRKGIDVSSWQGNINWESVKAAGIDFAIIRCGYGSDIKSQDDSKWLRNVQECERLGIPYGVYLYSYANTDSKAKSEAKHVLRLLKGHDPDYPVYYDLEDKVVGDAGRTAIIRRAEIFCSAIEAAGYKSGIYANLDWWNNKLNSSALDKYEKWVAQWNSECTYKGSYALWQCTSDGSVPGISGRVDLNFDFKSRDGHKDVVNYNPYRYADAGRETALRSGSGTSYSVIATIPKGTRLLTYGYDKYNGTDAWYKVKYGNKTGYATWNDVKLSYQAYSPVKKGKTTANLYMRSGVSTTYSKVKYIKSGSTLTLQGYYRMYGADWYKVTYGGKTGYVSSKYVKRL